MPSKRKRSDVGNTSSSSMQKKQVLEPASNPFLRFYYGRSESSSISQFDDSKNHARNSSAAESSTMTDDVFDEMVEFSDLSTLSFKKICSSDNDEENEMRVTQLQKSLEVLLKFLLSSPLPPVDREEDDSQKDPVNNSKVGGGTAAATSVDSPLVTRGSVVGLVLPWSIRGILQSEAYKRTTTKSSSSSEVVLPSLAPKVESLHWKALHGTLRSIRHLPENVESLLTLSTLHKIVPRALNTALSNGKPGACTEDDSILDAENVILARESFCYLVEYHYKPSFDTLCDSLLPILASSHAVTATKTWLELTMATIRLAQSRLASANPKRSFQLLIRPCTFLQLADVLHHTQTCRKTDPSLTEETYKVQNEMREFVSEAFFSFSHHIDGFRSLQLDLSTNLFDRTKLCEPEKKAALQSNKSIDSTQFHCYQEGLLSLFQRFIVQDQVDATGPTEGDACHVPDFITILIDAFLQQTSRLPEQQQQLKQNVSKKNKIITKITQLQFRFVACVIGYHVKALLGSNLSPNDKNQVWRLALLSAVARYLRLFLEYNVYRPSGQSNEEKKFLDSIGTAIVAAMTPHRGNNAAGVSSGLQLTAVESECAIEILKALFLLDHTTLHHHLVSILTWCMTLDATAPLENPSAMIYTQFLVTIIETYGKLRQLDLFYKAYNESLKALLREENYERLRYLNALARFDVVSAQLGAAVQTSPIQQVKQILAYANDTLANMIDSRGPANTRLAGISSATELLVGILRNIRVDSNTQNEIFPLVLETMHRTIPAMLGSARKCGRADPGLFTEALKLCSWTLDAKSRCEFWMTKDKSQITASDEADIPLSVLSALENAIDGQGHAGMSRQDQMRLFACQRIRQLHAYMFEKQKISFATDAEEYSTRDEISDARKLAGFVVRGGESIGQTVDVDSAHISWLLLAETLPTWAPHADDDHIDKFLSVVLKVLSKEVGLNEGNEKAIADLLHDSSFYEVPNVTRRLGKSVISYLNDAFAALLQNDQSMQYRLQFLGASLDEITAFCKNITPLKVQPSDVVRAGTVLRNCLNLFDAINDVQSSIWEKCDGPENVLESLLRIDTLLISSLLPSKCFDIIVLTSLARHLRFASSRILHALSDRTISRSRQGRVLETISLLIRSTSRFLGTLESADVKTAILASCSSLLASATRVFAITKQEPLEGIISILQTESAQEGSDLVTFCCAIGVLRGIRNVDLQTAKEILCIIKTHNWKKAQWLLISQMGTDKLSWNLSVVLLAEALRVSSNLGVSGGTSVCLSLSDQCTREVLATLGRKMSPNTSKHVSYLLSCLGLCQPSKDVRDEMVRELSQCYVKGNKAFKTPLCTFATFLEPKELSLFLESLCNTGSSQQAVVKAANVEVYHSMLLRFDEPAKIEALSNYSAHFLGNCLQLLAWSATVAPDDVGVTMTATSLIIYIASRKDIANIRERDIALAMSTVGATLQSCASLEEQDVVEYGVKAFEACYSLISFFLQRFSKQTHSCLSCLIRALMSMMEFVLYAPMQDTPLRDCGQRFCRLCELLLPHGEVYKKHVLCLVVQFVKGLSKSVDLNRKNNLLNGIYCLFDIIQEHETKQLNSMLDEMGKALLLSVHEGYKKHTYKGQ